MRQDVPVIVLNWNGWDDTFSCLHSLVNCGEVTTVWLVDNCSDKNRCDEAAAQYPGLRVLRWDDNYGWAGGYNRALAIAAAEGSEYAYLLNNDCTVNAGFLNNAVRVMRGDASLAAVGSCVCFSSDARFAFFDGTYHAFGTGPFVERRAAAPAREVNGAGMLVRMAAFRAIGPFDERYFCYAEETDWCARARAAGFDMAVALDSVVLHKREGSDVGNNALYYRTRNRLLFAKNAPHRRRGLDLGEAVGDGVRRWRSSGDPLQREAILHGLSDGLRGIYGRRGEANIICAISALMPIWSRQIAACDAIRRVRGGWRATRALRISVPLGVALMATGLRQQWRRELSAMSWSCTNAGHWLPLC